MKKHILFSLIAALLFVCSCTKESDPTRNIPAGEAEVEMDFDTPLGFAPGDETDKEKDVKNLLLLVFTGDDDNGEFLYSRYAWRKTPGETTFRTTLKIGSGQTIYFVANAKNFIEGLPASVLAKDRTWGLIKRDLVLTNGTGLDVSLGLPMWGRATNVTIADKSWNDLGTIKLLRSVASIDVGLSLENPSDFILERGHLVFAADKGFLPYDPSITTLVGDKLIPSAPTAPNGMRTNVSFTYNVPAGKNEISNIFYVYENTAEVNPPFSSENRQTKIILEGKWNGGSTTFYPLALRDRTKTNSPKVQVTRNTKYAIIITKVNGDGWSSLTDAKDAEDVNMDYEVITWEDKEDGEIMIDGPKYFSIPTKQAILSRSAESTFIIPFSTNFTFSDIKIKFNDSDTGVHPTLDTHNRFKIEILNGVIDGVTTKYFKFTAKLVYGTTDNPQNMIVSVGRLKFNIMITQKDREPWKDGGTTVVDPGE